MGTFWLKVRENYVIENFNELVNYLRDYVVPTDGSVDNDFEDTYRCLHKVACDKCDKARHSSNLFETFRGDDEIDSLKLVKLIATSVLTAHHFRQEDDYDMMLALANILLVNKRNITAKNCMDFLAFAKACTSRRDVKKLGLMWRSLDESIDVLTQHLLNTTWETEYSAKPCYFERQGVAIIDNEQLIISTQNREVYTRGKLQPVMTVANGAVEVRSKATDKLKARAKTLDVIAKTAELRTELAQFQAPAQKRLREYNIGDVMPVKIIGKRYNFFTVRTIDSRYKPIVGRLFVNPYELARIKVILREELYDKFEIGDSMVVEYVDNQQGVFELGKTVYNRFYADEANLRCGGEDAEAIFVSDFQGGFRWYTADGLILNVSEARLTGDEREYIDSAADGNHIVHVRAINYNTNETGNSVVNGVMCPQFGETHADDECVDPDAFARHARCNLLESFEDYIGQQVAELPEAETMTQLADPLGFIVVYRALYHLSHKQDTTLERVKTLATATLLAKCCDVEATADKEYMHHELKYLECGIRFVSGEPTDTLTLHHVESLDGIAAVAMRERMVKILSEYKQDSGLSNSPIILASTPSADALAEKIDEVDKLVEACNILRGTKIQDKSLARIKSEIASRLELADEYIPEGKENDATYYGVESDTLEFKSSIVFPPCNRRTIVGDADPKTQRWAIIKTVCGFLNSQMGGELYLGVNDNGYAQGLQDDIKTLFDRGLISIKHIDHYRTYVKNILDRVYQSYDKKLKGTDITNSTVRLDCITDNDNNEILHISVQPFKLDAVRIIDSSEYPRPASVAEAYIRTSGSTTPLTSLQLANLSRSRVASSKR